MHRAEHRLQEHTAQSCPTAGALSPANTTRRRSDQPIIQPPPLGDRREGSRVVGCVARVAHVVGAALQCTNARALPKGLSAFRPARMAGIHARQLAAHRLKRPARLAATPFCSRTWADLECLVCNHIKHAGRRSLRYFATASPNARALARCDCMKRSDTHCTVCERGGSPHAAPKNRCRVRP